MTSDAAQPPVGYADLPGELCDLIMRDAHARHDSVWCLYLALTCRRERARYARVVPADERLCYRDTRVALAEMEGTLVQGALVPGDAGYAYAKAEEVAMERRVWRQVTRKAREGKRRARDKVTRYRKAQWKRGVYE